MRFLVTLMLLAGLGTAAHAAEGKARVVASFSILGDMAQQVGGDAVDVVALVGPDGDAHGYQPTPDDVKAVSGASLVIINGLGFDNWMQRLVESAGYKGPVVVASTGVKPRTMAGEKTTDPHAWQDLRNGAIYTENIADGIRKTLPAQVDVLEKRKSAYLDAMKALDADVRGQIAALPEAQRLVITSHDAFGYFGAAYGVRFIAPYGMSTESEPSAKDVARLIDQVKKSGVHEVFIENMSNPRLIQQLAKDAGAKIGGTLYADALSAADAGAATYLDMFRNNVPKLVKAMQNTGI